MKIPAEMPRRKGFCLPREIIAYAATAQLDDVLHCSGRAAELFGQLEGRFPQVGELSEEL